jgi:hypothetical protein
MADEEEAAAPEEAPAPTTTQEELVNVIRTGAFADAAALIETTDLAGLTASGETALVACASAGRGELLTKLLNAGAPPDVQTVSGLTPLSAAATNGHLACVTKLADGGASLDLQAGTMQATALILAARNGHRAVCEALLERGADTTLADIYGDTAEDAAHRFETECRLYSHDFKQWQELVEERAAVIRAEPPPPPPPFPLNPTEDLTRFYRSTDPTKMLWRPGAWVHMKRPAAGPTVRQERPRPFEATGYGVEPPQVPTEHSVFPAERYAFAETLDALQGGGPDALTQTAAIALERSTKNPQFFNDDVAPTKQAQRAAITDADSAFASIHAQEKKLRDAFSSNECPLRIGNAPTYSSGLQHAYQSTPTAAVSLFPLLEYPREGAAPGEDTNPALTEISLSRLIHDAGLKAAAEKAAAEEGGE